MSVDDTYAPAAVETVRVVNVNIEDWSVDCVSELGNKRYFDIQVASPYFHFVNGEGVYVMPEVGCMAWLCKPSTGRFSTPFLMGFQAPFDTDHVSYRSGRQTLNPGDIMLRTRDENFLVLRRGGVIQIGATPTAQRIYVPLQNMIRDMCENYQLFSFGGEMKWVTERDDKTDDGSVPTRLEIHAKQKANDPLHVADLTIGSHEEDDTLILKLVVWTDGTKEREAQVRLDITNDGNVTWNVENDWNLTAAQNIILKALEGDYSVTTDKGKMTWSSKDNMKMTSQGDWNVEAKGAKIKADNIINLDSSKIRLGGSDARYSAVKFEALETFLEALIGVIMGLVCASTGAPIGVGAKSLKTMIEPIKSTAVYVK